MVRRLLCGVLIAGCAGAGALFAQERATFILNDGVRMSGTVVSQGGYNNRDRGNLRRGDLLLLADDGRRIPIRLDQVAVIQFGGGRPSPAELDALSYDNTQLMVRRNGSIEPGRFITMNASGDVVSWQRRNGRQQTIPVRDLTRIYLNADRARTAFNYTGRNNPGFRGNDPGFRDGNNSRFGNRNDNGFGNGNNGNNRNNGNDRNNGNNGNNRGVGTAGSGLNANVQVNANQGWTGTGVNVRAGDLVVFRASGRINFGQGATQNAGPDGNDSLKNNPAYPVSAMPVGGLVGRVGNSAPFPIGSNTQPIRMPANGTLMLGVNDNELVDNSGSFSVAITGQ